MLLTDIKIGQVMDNQTLSAIFKCSTQGGMRRSHRTNSLVIITDATKTYHDQWKADILHYTGMGLRGDQNFFEKQNNTVYYSRSNGVKMHLFEVRAPRSYTYIGQVELADEPYMSRQIDQDKKERAVCIFPLKVIR